LPLWRGDRDYVYSTCYRCGRRMPLGIMRWQYGLLVCDWTDCIDLAVVGSRDLAVARAMTVDRHELQPDPKLYDVKDPAMDLNDVPYSPEEG
jgi:hypothetical protein